MAQDPAQTVRGVVMVGRVHQPAEKRQCHFFSAGTMPEVGRSDKFSRSYQVIESTQVVCIVGVVEALLRSQSTALGRFF